MSRRFREQNPRPMRGLKPLKGLESELEELREDAKRKEKDAIQKIIDAVVS